MAAPTPYLQRFQPPPWTPSQILIAQFNVFLEAGNVGIRSQTTTNNAQTVIDIIKRRINAHILPPTAQDEQRLQHFIDIAYSVIHGTSVKDIAIDHGIAPEGVRRIINVIGVAVQICLGHCDTRHARAVNIWSILDPTLHPIGAVDATTPWPDQVMQHATALLKAVDAIPHTFLKPGLVAVPLSHLEYVRNGAAHLGQSLVNVQAKAREKQVVKSSSSGRIEVDSQALPTPLGAREQPKKLLLNPQGPESRSRNVSAEPPLRRSPPTSFDPDRNRTAKRAISQSRGTNPVKKKIKENISEFEAYQLFVLAERSCLEAEYPTIEGSDLSELLSTIWAEMKPEERYHFEDLQLKLQAREEQGIATGVTKKIEIVRAIPRCQTVIDAIDTYVSPEQRRRHRLQADRDPARSQSFLDRFTMRPLLENSQQLEPKDIKTKHNSIKGSHEVKARPNADNVDAEDKNTSKAVKQTGTQKITKVDDDAGSNNGITNRNNNQGSTTVSRNGPAASIEAMSPAARWYENHTAFDEDKAKRDAASMENATRVQDKDGDENMDEEML